MILCLKVGDNGDFVFISGSAIDEVLDSAQNGSIFLKISAKVLATITLKYFQNVKSSLNKVESCPNRRMVRYLNAILKPD